MLGILSTLFIFIHSQPSLLPISACFITSSTLLVLTTIPGFVTSATSIGFITSTFPFPTPCVSPSFLVSITTEEKGTRRRRTSSSRYSSTYHLRKQCGTST